MLVATIICFNDYPLIRSTIESIYDKVDKIIAVDGAYDEFPCDINYSTDGTIYYLDSMDKVELIIAPGLAEVAKRNLYLNELKVGDICFNLDADEILVGDIPELRTDFGICDWHDGHSRHIQRRATKLFRYYEGMKYQHCHYTLYDSNGIMINKLNEVVNPNFTSEYIRDFYLVHNWHLRSDLRKFQKSQYYKKLIQIESKFPK